jgi:heme-degrading monooxygenase HmoA
VGELTEFVMFTLWDSLDAVKAFAGEDYETAVFYPEDDRYLVERDETSTHFEVARHAGTPSRTPARACSCRSTST